MNTEESVVGPINLGNPDEFTILQLAELVIEMTGSKSKIARFPLPQDDPRQRQPDIQKAREILEWAPTIALKQGLRKTIDYFDDRQRHGLID
jgi:UDP-glucuronate decarboxylase